MPVGCDLGSVGSTAGVGYVLNGLDDDGEPRVSKNLKKLENRRCCAVEQNEFTWASTLRGNRIL